MRWFMFVVFVGINHFLCTYKDIFSVYIACWLMFCACRQWFLDPTWLHKAFSTSMPCVWIHCSCAFVSMIVFKYVIWHTALKMNGSKWKLWFSSLYLPACLDGLSLLSLCFAFFSWLSLCVLSAIPASFLSWDLVSGEDLERNDSSSSRPYYMSPGLHKILRKGEESAKSCSVSWAVCRHFTVDSHSLLYFYCICGVWTFQSKYCRAKYQNCMHPGLVRDDQDMKGKTHAGLYKNLCSLDLLS